MIFGVPKVYLQNTTKAEREARLQGAFNWDYSNLAFSVNTHTSKAWILFYFFSFIQILVVRETDKNNDLSVSLTFIKAKLPFRLTTCGSRSKF